MALTKQADWNEVRTLGPCEGLNLNGKPCSKGAVRVLQGHKTCRVKHKLWQTAEQVKARELLEAFEDRVVANILRVVTDEPLLKELDVRVRLHSEAVAKPRVIIDLCELMKKRGEL